MYHLQVTAKSYRMSTTVSVSLWRVEDTGARDLLRLGHLTIPKVQGGLFEESPDEFLEFVQANFAEMVTDTRDTRQ